MEKPIVVKLGTGKIKDSIKYMEDGVEKERLGLCKRVSPDFLEQPFSNLVSYMCNPAEDDFNLAYSQSETDLANQIEALVAQNDVVLSASKGNGFQLEDIALNTIVGDKYEQISKVEEIHYDGQNIPVNSIDLIVMTAMGGGMYR